FVNGATKLATSIYSRSLSDRVNRILKCLQQIKSLRIVSLGIAGKHMTSAETVEIAKAINGLELISRIEVKFSCDTTTPNHDQWTRTIEFAEALYPSKRSKLELEMYFDCSVTPQQARALSPYLATLRAADREETCTTKAIRDIFSYDDNIVSAA